MLSSQQWPKIAGHGASKKQLRKDQKYISISWELWDKLSFCMITSKKNKYGKYKIGPWKREGTSMQKKA